jgi:hypothetical protein
MRMYVFKPENCFRVRVDVSFKPQGGIQEAHFVNEHAPFNLKRNLIGGQKK